MGSEERVLTYVRAVSGLAVNYTQATRRRSCCVLRLSVPFNRYQMIHMYMKQQRYRGPRTKASVNSIYMYY